MSEPERLKPWRRARQTCFACANRATKVVTGVEWDDPPFYEVDGELRVHVREETRKTLYVCLAHYEATMDDLCEEFGGSSGNPIRDSWKYYFLVQLPWRLFRLDLAPRTSQ